LWRAENGCQWLRPGPQVQLPATPARLVWVTRPDGQRRGLGRSVPASVDGILGGQTLSDGFQG